jgi:hypothetical protein
MAKRTQSGGRQARKNLYSIKGTTSYEVKGTTSYEVKGKTQNDNGKD